MTARRSRALHAARPILIAVLIAVLPRLALHLKSLSARELGRIGEALAERYLARRGLSIVARRLATRAGEIDLLARDGRTWACVEVKTGRIGARFRPGQRIDARRLARLRAAARLVARERGAPARVDLVEVALGRDGRLAEIRHVRDLRAPLGRGPRGLGSREMRRAPSRSLAPPNPP